jgi:peptidoglycan/LPS O-acetylase OafA/YrhL
MPPTSDPQPQRRERVLIDRLRFIFAIIASMAAAFVVEELVTAPHPFGAFLAFRVAGVVFPLVGFFVLRRPWAEAWARPLTIGIVCFAYLFVAAAGMASPTGEYATTAFLFVGAALLTATVLPWGRSASPSRSARLRSVG